MKSKIRRLNLNDAASIRLLSLAALAVAATLVFPCCFVSGGSDDRVSEPLFQGSKPQPATGTMQKPQAIILMIADGGGFNQFKAADYWRSGTSPAAPYTEFELNLAVSTWPAGGSYDSEKAWNDFGYPPVGATDSAAAATALATGFKTSNGRISTDATGHSLSTLLEKAESKGMMTGIVTSVPFSHATPAAFAAHADSRTEYSGIADQMLLSSGLDVLMGAGDPESDNDGNAADPRYDWVSQGTWESLKAGTAANDRNADGLDEQWTLVRDRADFTALENAADFMHAAGIPRVHDTLQERRSGDAKADAYAVPANENVPTLETMALGALNLLSKSGSGFVLLIESGAVDWANHANQSGRLIEEADGFARAVEAVRQWIAADGSRSNTLLIVTADHESGYLWGEGSGPFNRFYAITNRGAGKMPEMEWFSTGHTNSLVPFHAQGTNAAFFANDLDGFDSRRGWYIDNAAIGRRLLAMLE